MHRRTALITAGSIVAVVLTGATAVWANIGILSSAGASDVGDLTAVVDVATETVPADGRSSTPTSTGAVTTQSFVADAAGTVDVRFGDGTVRLGRVDAVDGWTWTANQTSDTSLQVSFVAADGQELEFFAELLPDGSLSARVDETVIETVQVDPDVIVVSGKPGASATAVPVSPVQSGSTSGRPPAGAQPAGTVVPVPSAVPPAPSPPRVDNTDDDRDDWDDNTDDDRDDRDDDRNDDRDDRDDDRTDDWDDRDDDRTDDRDDRNDRDDDRDHEHEYEGADDDD